MERKAPPNQYRKRVARHKPGLKMHCLLKKNIYSIEKNIYNCDKKKSLVNLTRPYKDLDKKSMMAVIANLSR